MKKGAFTLVELIVVITILAILATIGFVSFSGYLAWTRDTNRVAQLKSMSDALELYSTKKSLPIPDDKVDIKALSLTMWYQWYIWKNVLETIEYTESWLDPKDKNYFSYYLTKNKKYFQLLAFLEEESEDIIAYNAINAVDYSDRKVKVTWRKLWILTDISKTPIQEIPTLIGSWYLDVAVTTDSYIAHKSDNEFLTGSWWEIFSLFYHWSKQALNDKSFAQYDNSLVWYWDMETLDWWLLRDFSQYWNNGILHWGVSIWWIKWKIGEATLFDWDDDYISIPNSTSLNPEKITIITVSKSSWNGINSGDYPRVIWKWSETWTPAEQYAFWWVYTNINNENKNFQFRLDTEERSWWRADVDDQSFWWVDNQWNTFAFSYNQKRGDLFIDWDHFNYEQATFDGRLKASTKDLYIWNTSWASGTNRAYYWLIDEIRIYNRDLGADEIRNIYKFQH